MPLRAVYRRALARDEVALNPTTGVELAAVRGKRDRIAAPVEAANLLAALDDTLAELFATAFYAGLRLGELRALRDEDINLDAGLIRVSAHGTRKPGRSRRRAPPACARYRSSPRSAPTWPRTGSAAAPSRDCCSGPTVAHSTRDA